ncbi:MAG: GAF domain-containing sensor histidine kinase [Chloroflexi bacterium]|nr:GAF domain-containing sensor histidine kinase [Anaerolineaceae bacterium]NMB89941.1 GAF domain-containing sensor histidine kinase [Chloroflexota bacterium]
MRSFEYPFPADWFVISIRWLAVVAALTALNLALPLSWEIGLVLAVFVLWNILLTFLALQNIRLTAHRPVNILVDSVITVILFVLSGGFYGPLNWIGLLPIFSAAVYYEWRGSLLGCLVVTLLQVGWEYVNHAMALDTQALLYLAGINLSGGIVFGVLSASVMRRFRRTYQNHVRQRRELERQMQRQERARIQAFYRMIETLSATLNYQVVLDTTLDLSVLALGSGEALTNQLVSAVMLFDDEQLKIAVARRFPPRDIKQIFPANKGALEETIHSGEPIHLQNPSEDPELGQLVALQGCKSSLCLPLNRGLNAYGVMLYAHPDPAFFTQDRRELLEMLSHQVVIAIQNARLFQELELEKERILESQEEARKKLARDLHDGPTQSVSSIAMRISIARKFLERDVKEADEELVRIEELARRTTQEIRHMLFTLRPLALESQGLEAALKAMATKMMDTYQQNVNITIDSQVVSGLELGKQTVVFYLAEEAVNNARKHAQAARIDVVLKPLGQDRSIALLEIIDNGVGFNVEEVTSAYERRGSLGMVNLQERADLINGLLHIDSAPGKGTRVQVAIPLTEEAADRIQRGIAAV